MGRFKMVVLVKTFDHYDHKFQVFQLSCKIVKELKRNWNLDRNLIITLLIMAICTVVWQALYNFKTKRPRRQDITNFYLKMFKIMRSLRSAKCLKTRVELKFTTQKANTCSSFTACSVFYWKYLFWVNLVQKQIISFLGKFSPNYQFKLKFCTKTNWNMQTSTVMLTFSVFNWKYLFGQTWSTKSKLSVWAEISH